MDKILWIDRDGTIVEEPHDFTVDALEKIRWVPGVIPALLALQAHGFRMVMVTNQDGIGSERFPRERFELCHEFIMHTLRTQGVAFEAVLVCPHTEEDGCDCRKPKTKMIDEYLKGAAYDTAHSAVIGDRLTDLELARRLGCQGIRIGADDGDTRTWPEIVALLTRSTRAATLKRHTKETQIDVAIDCDQVDPVSIRTGLGFFDHMLEQVARHGGFALTIAATGDLHIDEHHLVEDCALALGEALKTALGDRRGIQRYGFWVPMDESLAEVVIDLSNRPVCVFEGEFGREQVGALPTELVPHFFKSVSDALGAAVHVKVKGDNTHHMIEACFKAFGRALRMAMARQGSEVPSTKGTLS